MPKGLIQHDDNLDVSSSEDESLDSSEIDLLNPRQPQSGTRKNSRFSRFVETPNVIRACSFANERTAVTKLPSEEIRPALIRGFQCRRVSRNQSVTFAESEKSTFVSRHEEPRVPRIIRAIRRHSEKFTERDRRIERSPIRHPPHEKNSKSSVVVLYHGEDGESPPVTRKCRGSLSSSSSDVLVSKPVLRVAKSEETIVTTALPIRSLSARRDEQRSTSVQHLVSDALNDNDCGSGRSSAARNSILCPGKLRRRRRYRYYGKRESTNANIATRENRGLGRVSNEKSSVKGTWCRENGRIEDLKTPRVRCRRVDYSSGSLRLMAHRSTRSRESERVQLVHEVSGDEDIQIVRGTNRPGFALFDNDEEYIDGETYESQFAAKRRFPFQSTASGNLKVVPNQVVYETNKVSVLVADPCRTRVNVKAELCEEEDHAASYQAINNIDRDQTHTFDKVEKYVPRTQPYRSSQQSDTRFVEMEETLETRQDSPDRNEVPLTSLGFTGQRPIDWENISLPEKTDLYSELARRITNYKNADCIVRLGPDEFHCHLLVLQSYSTYFDEKNSKETDLTGSSVTSKAFGIIYDWMISPTSESRHLLRRDNILEIFTASQMLGIKELEEQCWAFIDNDELFSEDTAFLLYLEARKMNNTAVMELMVPRIVKFFLILVGTRDFVELAVEDLCQLLRSNYISVNSEMEVLMSAVRWLMHDWLNRKQYTIKVLECIRFGLMAPWQLVDVKRNPENPEFMELMSYPEVQKMVDDGLAFVIIKCWYDNQTEDYYHWIDLLRLTEPTERNWAGEDKVPLFAVERVARRCNIPTLRFPTNVDPPPFLSLPQNYVTYREFLLHLEEYRRTRMTELEYRNSTVANRGNAEVLPSGEQQRLGTNSRTNEPNPLLPDDANSCLGNQERIGINSVSGKSIPDREAHANPMFLLGAAAASGKLQRSGTCPSRTSGTGTLGPIATMLPQIFGGSPSSIDRNGKGVSRLVNEPLRPTRPKNASALQTNDSSTGNI